MFLSKTYMLLFYHITYFILFVSIPFHILNVTSHFRILNMYITCAIMAIQCVQVWKLSMNKYLPFYKYIMALPLVLALSLSTVKHPYELSSSPTFGHTYRLKFNPDSGTAIQSHLCFNPSYPILHCQYLPQYQSRGCYCHHYCQEPKYPLSQHKQKP